MLHRTARSASLTFASSFVPLCARRNRGLLVGDGASRLGVMRQVGGSVGRQGHSAQVARWVRDGAHPQKIGSYSCEPSRFVRTTTTGVPSVAGAVRQATWTTDDEMSEAERLASSSAAAIHRSHIRAIAGVAQGHLRPDRDLVEIEDRWRRRRLRPAAASDNDYGCRAPKQSRHRSPPSASRRHRNVRSSP